MNKELRIGKSVVWIISFLFLLGIAMMIFRSGFFLQLGIENESQANLSAGQQTSALSSEEEKQFQQDKLLLIYDPDTAFSIKLRDNMTKTLDYMKKEYQAVPVSQLPEDFSSYQNVIIAFSSLEKIDDVTRITDYAAEGGKLFFAVRPELNSVYFSIYSFLGIEEPDNFFKNTTGIEMSSNLLLKGNDLKVEQNFISNSSLSVQLSSSVEIFARSSDRTPLLWSNPYGKGKIMVFNGTMLESKMNRGIIAGSLSYLNEDFIYPVLNSKVVYIDDFPSPFPEGVNEKIYEDYNMDIQTFFREVWWPDMVQLAEKYDIKYTGVMIETYDDDVNGPFDERLAEENLKIYGRELITMGGEVGIHGYNHQSLTKDQNQVKDLGYTAWESDKDMVESLKEVNKFFHKLFPDYDLHTYVPPSNVLSEDGKKAIREAVPSVQNIASLYHPDTEMDSYIQEFDTTGEFNEIPRFTSDYLYRKDAEWIIANSSTLHGAFSHFVHPDDILDDTRSESKDWEGLLKEFQTMMSDVKEKYPWMRSQTASESAVTVTEYQNAEVLISQKSEEIDVYINNFAGELNFILRSDKEIAGSKNSDIEKISNDRYLIQAKSANFKIELRDN